ncbi:uncharacterized protein [Eurosta solidaginis]|uniref:uncharacterized protein n=1 Tax=Eurosta solidaginis TaxID=178769 RepID=UPI0035313E92
MAGEDNSSVTEKLGNQESSPFDCSFLIGSGASASTIEAHKSKLSCASIVFASMFNGNYKEADASANIPLPNVLDIIDFKVILEYIYYEKTDSLDLLTIKRLKHVAFLADYYMLEKLLTACHGKISTKVQQQNTSFHDFLQIFEYEKKLGREITYIKYKNCGHYYKSNFPYDITDLATNSSIYDLEPEIFYDLLKFLQGKFKEIERFCLIENYAKIHGLKMDGFASKKLGMVDNFGEAHTQTPTPGKTLKEMFDLINFKSMSVNQFVIGPAVSEIWIASSEEQLRILTSVIHNHF